MTLKQKVDILKELIEEATKEGVNRLIHLMEEDDRVIFERALPIYQRSGRWYDPYHIVVISTPFMIAATKDFDERQRSILTKAIILHDIGYGTVEDKDNWEGEDQRIQHMKEGVGFVRSRFSDLIPEDEIEDVASIIETHDGPYIGIPLDTEIEMVHRDGDRVFVMSYSSFVKDYATYIGKGRQVTPEEFLTRRLVYFYKPEEVPKQIGFTLSQDVAERFANTYEPAKLDFTREYITEQFIRRAKDVKANLFNMDTESFRTYSKERIEEELRDAEGFLRGTYGNKR